MNRDEVATNPAATPKTNGSTEPSPSPQLNDGAPSTAPHKPIFLVASAMVAAALLLAFGVPRLLYALSHRSTNDAYVDADVVVVTSKIQEKIDEILVTTNQPVRKGQLLVVLDGRVEIANLHQAQANYNLALVNQRTTAVQEQGGMTQASSSVSTQQAQVPVARAGVDEAQAELAAAIAAVPAAQQTYNKAHVDFRRTASLVHTGDVAREELDSARAELAQDAAGLRSAHDQVSAARANVVAALSKVPAQEANVEGAQGGVTTAQGKLQQAADPSQVEAVKAQLEQAKLNLAFTHIRSPIDGTVGQKSAEAGQTVDPGTTIMTVIPQNVYITANYKETQMGNMHVGQPVDIHVDAYDGVTFHGHVASINPASENTYAIVPPQNATGNYVKVAQRIPVRIYVDDARSNMPLRPGMSVETSVLVK